jgi:hypothetical protein
MLGHEGLQTIVGIDCSGNKLQRSIEINQESALGVEGLRRFNVGGNVSVACTRRDGGEELREHTAFEKFRKNGGGVALESYGERQVFAHLVLHRTESFVQGVDDEVAGASMEGFFEGVGVRLDAEGDCSGNV